MYSSYQFCNYFEHFNSYSNGLKDGYNPCAVAAKTGGGRGARGTLVPSPNFQSKGAEPGHPHV